MSSRLRDRPSSLAVATDLARVRARTDALFALVPDTLVFERPVAERHRLAFYLGHLEAFDANLLVTDTSHVSPDHALDRLFAFGIDPVGGGLPTDTPDDWPSIADIRAYAARTRERVDAALAAVGSEDAARLHTALEHRTMHAETLAYLFNRLSLPRPARRVPATTRDVRSDPIDIPAGSVWLGQRSGFGWDNEFDAHRVDVPAFRIDRHMVTNGAFLRFIEDGGYAEAAHWQPADWQWRVTHGVTHPASWQRHAGDWHIVSRADLVPFQSDWPVYVSHAEAAAYARWAGARLPSEAEWMRAAYGDGDAPYPWGDARPDRACGNFGFASWDPMPVDAHPGGASASGVMGMLGNGWEWTRTPFAPYPGFRPAPYYLGYSADFFDDAHYVLKGGSAHTDHALLRRSFRNWFQPHYPYVFAGFRCVEST